MLCHRPIPGDDRASPSIMERATEDVQLAS